MHEDSESARESVRVIAPLVKSEGELLVEDSLRLHAFCVAIANRNARGIRRSAGDVAVALTHLHEVRDRLLRLRDGDESTS